MHITDNTVHFPGRSRDSRYDRRSNVSFLADVTLDADSDDELTGGVPVHCLQDGLDSPQSSHIPHHCFTTTSSIRNFQTSDAPSPSIGSTSMCDLLHSESSDTDLDMHLDECEENNGQYLTGLRNSRKTRHCLDTEDLESVGAPDDWAASSIVDNIPLGLISFPLPTTSGSTIAITSSQSSRPRQTDSVSSGIDSAVDDDSEAEGGHTSNAADNHEDYFSDAFVPTTGRQIPLDPSIFTASQSPEAGSDFEYNLTASEFFEYWKLRQAFNDVRFPPMTGQLQLLDSNIREPSCSISIENLDYEKCDYQGIDWTKLGAKRADARNIRNMLYYSYRNITDTEDHLFQEHQDPTIKLPSSDNSFRFRSFMPRHKSKLAHYQLRHLLAAPTKNAVFFPTTGGVLCTNTTLGTQQCVMDFGKRCHDDGITIATRVSTLVASDGVLVIGGYEGEYAMKSLFSANDGCFASGLLSQDTTSITNHVHTFPSRRSGLPQAVFCSNDSKMRILDCYTDTAVQVHDFDWIVNCSATSPDGRLRLIVGDIAQPFVVDAETGRKIAGLKRHHDYGFACDWSPNGVYMATGSQDGSVQIWDARNWDRPLLEEAIGTELGCVRSLRFSPIGGGRPVLLMAEPADIVSVVDAVTFATTQQFDFFGEIGGTAFVPDGSSFFVANTDRTLGGLFEFERVQWGGYGKDDTFTARRLRSLKNMDLRAYRDEECVSDDDEFLPEAPRNDWLPEEELDANPRVVHNSVRRRCRGMPFDHLVF